VLRSFSDIQAKVKEFPRRTVVVLGAANVCILEAVLAAHERGLANFILIDARKRIVATLEELGHDASALDPFEVVEEEDCVRAAQVGVRIVHEGRAALIAKGRLQTFQMIGAVLDKETGLRRENSIISDVMVIEKPFEKEARLIGMSDPALCVLPSVEQKVKITRQAVEMFHSLGFERPRVAVLAALEVVKDTMPATVEAAQVVERIQQIMGDQCFIEGPLSMDIACSERAAEVKGRQGPVAGWADLLIVPNLEAGNIMAKTVATFTQLAYGHLIIGAGVPIVMSSRSDSSASKYHGLLLGLLCAAR